MILIPNSKKQQNKFWQFDIYLEIEWIAIINQLPIDESKQNRWSNTIDDLRHLKFMYSNCVAVSKHPYMATWLSCFAFTMSDLKISNKQKNKPKQNMMNLIICQSHRFIHFLARVAHILELKKHQMALALNSSQFHVPCIQ